MAAQGSALESVQVDQLAFYLYLAAAENVPSQMFVEHPTESF
jgi:hypothetical protein